MVEGSICKLKECLNKDVPVQFKILYSTNKICYTNTKDRTALLSQSSVVYEFKCPGCHANYVGKTESTIWERTHDHSWSQKDKPIYQHLSCCAGFQYHLSISKYNRLFTDNNQTQIVNDTDFLIETVTDNIKVIDKASRWDLLLIKGLRIKELSPSVVLYTHENRNYFEFEEHSIVSIYCFLCLQTVMSLPSI